MEERKVNKMGSFGNQEDFDCPDGAHRIGDKGSALLRNHHPTVKPLALMEYLVRLITPPGGIVLDPFCGSGTTLIACVREGCQFIGIDKDPEYVEIARRRVGRWLKDGKQLSLIRPSLESINPLFGESE
jgi:DNA modification methylase